MKIRNLLYEDWPMVAKIYQEGIDTKMATFESKVPTWDHWNKSHLEHSRWVAEVDGKIAGWVALSSVSDRCVYGGVAEISIYVGKGFARQGVGLALLQKVSSSSEKAGIWTLTSQMFSINGASKALHQKAGFREVGYREKIGKMDGKWFDNTIMERRSTAVD